MAATNVIWARGLFKELGIQAVIPSDLTTIYVDKQRAMKLAENPGFQKKSKRIAIKYHYTRDLIKEKEIRLEYKPTAEMIADGLTKPLGPIRFKKFVS